MRMIKLEEGGGRPLPYINIDAISIVVPSNGEPQYIQGVAESYPANKNKWFYHEVTIGEKDWHQGGKNNHRVYTCYSKHGFLVFILLDKVGIWLSPIDADSIIPLLGVEI